MKTSLTVLGLTLVSLCAAEVLQMDENAGDKNGTRRPATAPAQPSAGDISQSQERSDYIFVVLRELEAKQRNTEKQLEDLKTQIQSTRVAFGASMGNVGNVGPYSADITLTYNNVFINTGSYNPSTGIFTAPVRGIYYFSFSGHNQSTRSMGLSLMRNGVLMVTVFNHAAGSRHETATKGMTLQLNVGDHVYMRLWQNTWIFDNVHHHSTFSGFLLFPL